MGRMTFADSTGPLGPAESLRHPVARKGRVALRVLAAPAAVAAVAVAGALFLILLPICGIASIAEGVARDAWRFLRATLHSLAPYRSQRS
jgi:hypothetical protein